ncbi:phage major capsid protein [Sphingobium yanoikuyae]|jgi:HK97 family phage major capsid protein|uniref:Phage major capsid protein n=1 Tax=Sphingobium yanoikuyae TaxID=13690 RepID=A0A0J9D0M7_SPHYA|nr:phage major capsid protein [Sphingobium yanoikuyae]ATP18561.1 phage major capsid protein [Sphingobium yanoikuyae]KMW30196.1 capsid protein [Sphingobium yanoikuyae]
MADYFNELKTLEHEFKAAIDRKDEAATERLNDAISTVEAKMRDLEKVANRAAVENEAAAADQEAKAAFSSYMRRGSTAEIKAMSATGGDPVGSEGGYTVPRQLASNIRVLLTDLSPFRSVANVISVSTPDFRIPVSPAGAAAVWTGEKAARNETGAPTIVEVVPTFGELTAKPYVTQTLLEDSAYDIEQFITSSVATEFARAEGAAFISGDGVNKPKGLLSVTTALTADAARAYGTVQHVTSGAASDITNPDKLLALTLSLKAPYRVNAKWLTNRDALLRARTLKDTTGQYIWRAGLEAGQASTLLGYEVVEDENMPLVAAGAIPMAFGDFKAAYTIADRVQISVLRDIFSADPYVAFRTRMRVGGVVVDTNAYKLLKVGA